ncbi:hypothetical protein D7Y21_14960 [Corallococcus sp. AB045]|nr:hypothetical protein D7Y21_14960 [Corallococcus sp. AB045]
MMCEWDGVAPRAPRWEKARGGGRGGQAGGGRPRACPFAPRPVGRGPRPTTGAPAAGRGA